MKVQARIWHELLTGLPDETIEGDSDEAAEPERLVANVGLNHYFIVYPYEGMFSHCFYMDPPRYLWTLWGLEARRGGKELIPHWVPDRLHDPRVIHIVIGFLGPFRPWQVTHTSGVQYWRCLCRLRGCRPGVAMEGARMV